MRFNKFKMTQLLFVMLMVFSCNSDDSPSQTAQDLAFEKLSGSWNLSPSSSITLDGKEVGLNYVGFSLSFAEGSFKTNNAGGLFSATGSWEWTNDISVSQVTLDDGKLVTIDGLTENRFEFSFTHSKSTGGEGVSNGVNNTMGSYKITVQK